MILINRTFEETTPESVELGEFFDIGFISENEEITFKELVDILGNTSHCSCYPINTNIFTWFSNSSEITDYSQGIERTENIHYSRDNLARSEKYWKKAINYVFNVKE